MNANLSSRGLFDGDAFFAALDSHRQARHQTWKEVAGEAGVSASTLTRMSQGKRPDVDSLAALATWAGLSVNDFVRKGIAAHDTEPLAAISTYIRRDEHLSPEAAIALEEVVRSTYRRLRREGPKV